MTPCEWSWQKQLRALPCSKLPNLLIWGLIYGLGSRNLRRLLEILYLDFFLHLPFIVIRIIETALFSAENPESVIVFVLVYSYSQISAKDVVQFAVSSGFLILGRKISHFRFDWGAFLGFILLWMNTHFILFTGKLEEGRGRNIQLISIVMHAVKI